MQFRTCLIIILLALSLPLAYSTEDFRIESTAKVSLCTQSLQEDFLLITNAGDTTSVYSIQLSGSAAPYTTFEPVKIELDRGEQAIVRLFYQFPTNAKGTYELLISVSSGGIAKQLSKGVSPKLCNNNILLAYNFNQTACPCTRMTYDFSIYNPGQTKENYFIGLDTFSSYANVTENPVAVEPGASRNFSLFLKPACDIHGDYAFNLFSNAQTTGITTKVPLLANIERCYDFTIDSGRASVSGVSGSQTYSAHNNSYDFCAGDNATIPIRLSNRAHIANDYAVSLSGPGWASIAPRNVSAAVNEEAYPSITLSVPDNQESENPLILSAESSIGKEFVDYPFSVGVSDCHEIILEAPDEEIICNCDKSEIPVNVMNRGDFDEDIVLRVNGSEFVSVDPSQQLIAKGNRSSFRVSIEPPCNYTSAISITLDAELSNKRARASEPMQLRIIPKQECYDISITPRERLSLAFESKDIPIRIKHTGKKSATYSVNLTGKEWMSIDTRSFSLQPGGMRDLLLTLDARNVSSGRYFASLFIEANSVIYQRDFEIRVSEESSTPFGFLYTYRYWIYASLILAIIATFLAIVACRRIIIWKTRRIIKKEKATNKKTSSPSKNFRFGFWILIAALMLLAILFALFFIPGISSEALDFLVFYRLYIAAGFLVLFVVILALRSLEKK